jgi:hypothetical protein
VEAFAPRWKRKAQASASATPSSVVGLKFSVSTGSVTIEPPEKERPHTHAGPSGRAVKGIARRIALIDAATVDAADARFMLVNCSAFANFLISR